MPIFVSLAVWCIRTAISVVECQLLSLTKVPLNSKPKLEKWKVYSLKAEHLLELLCLELKKKKEIDQVWLLCPTCTPIAFISRQTEGKSHGRACVCSSGSHLGGHPQGLCFGGDFWPRDMTPCSIQGWEVQTSPEGWVSHSPGHSLSVHQANIAP